MIRNTQLPDRYTPPTVAKVGHFNRDTHGTIYTKKDATTVGFKKPR
ncbi:lasso RiPP family leader peptide-containing protein [Streptomyces sp. NPDC020096]